MTKEEREKHEYTSLFKDERYARKAWRDFIGCSLESPAAPLPASYDKEGNLTFQSQLDYQAYDNVKARLKSQGLSREPMQAELIVESNILRARFNDATFGTILERTAGKVKEEFSVTQSPFEELSDEELALLAEHRKSKA